MCGVSPMRSGRYRQNDLELRTKVRQILESASPGLLRAVRQGTVSIHRAWQWRERSPAQQREALWTREHRTSTDHVIRQLIARQHHPQSLPESGTPNPEKQLVLEALSADPAIPFLFAVAEIPGLALVVTRELRDRLVSRSPSS